MNAWRLICCQNVRNEFFVLHSMALKMCNGQQHIHVCHSDLHSACMESICFAQTFPFPNCLMRMWNTLAVDIPTFAAVTVHIMLWSSLSMAWTHSTCLSSVDVASMSPQGVSFCMLPPITYGIHRPATVTYNGEWVPCISIKRSWSSCDVFPSRKWNSYHSANPHVYETSLQLFLVHCSCGSERGNIQLHPTIPQCQYCWHTALHIC